MHWLNSHSDEMKEKIYAVMREMGREGDRYREQERKLLPKFGEIAAGAAGFDHTLKATMIEAFLDGLRKGENPNTANESAFRAGFDAVKIHNTRRKKDINWARAEPSGNELLAWVIRLRDLTGQS